MRVAVIGMGKTGLPIAVALRRRGCEVVGVEVSERRLKELRDPVWKPAEPGCWWEARKGIDITSDLGCAIRLTDLAILIVQTPETELGSGVIDLRPLITVTEQIASSLSRQPKLYSLILSSTVMPGTCDKVIAPRVGPNCEVLFSPIWIAQGSIVEDYLNPPVLVVGSGSSGSPSPSSPPFPLLSSPLSYPSPSSPLSPCFSPSSSSPPSSPSTLSQFLDKVWPSILPIYTDRTTAEAMKLVHNVWCTLKMAFANEAAQWCAEIGGDPRIVEKFLKAGGERPGAFLRPGPPPGGPCFPRDLRFVGELGVSTFQLLVWAVQMSNQEGIRRLSEAVKGYHVVGIAGLSYKPGVPIGEESSSYLLAEGLRSAGHEVVGYDPMGLELGGGSVRTLEELLEKVDIVVEMHPGTVPLDCLKPVVRPWIVRESC